MWPLLTRSGSISGEAGDGLAPRLGFKRSSDGHGNTRIGPADNGRRMSLEEFEPAEGVEGYSTNWEGESFP